MGSTGYIAKYIIQRFKSDSTITSVLRIGRDKDADSFLDLLRVEQFDFDILDDIDFVVFTAAVSSPDLCESEYDSCWNVNVIGTSRFIQEAIKRNCKVLFFSSDAVYGDIPGKIYDEECKTEASTAYGKMKKAIEDLFKNNSLFKAIRLSYVVSANDKFTSYCIDCLKNNITANIYHPFYRSVTVISDVLDVVYYFAYHWNKFEHSFLNVSGCELVSRIRIADEINRFMNYKLKYKISVPGDDFFKSRPKITQMRSLYLNSYGILQDGCFTNKLSKELRMVSL